jgi:hypothetical protein
LYASYVALLLIYYLDKIISVRKMGCGGSKDETKEPSKANQKGAAQVTPRPLLEKEEEIKVERKISDSPVRKPARKISKNKSYTEKRQITQAETQTTETKPPRESEIKPVKNATVTFATLKFEKADTEDEFGLSTEEANNPVCFFFFDFDKVPLLHYYPKWNLEWKTKNLVESTTDIPNFSLLHFSMARREKENKSLMNWMSCCAGTQNIIYLIGGHHPLYNCIEYDISKNFFKGKSSMKNMRKRPTLCKFGHYIYSISGEAINGFSKNFERYDTKTDTWTQLKDMPVAQFQSTAQAFETYDRFLQTRVIKIAVLGGLSSKQDKSAPHILSLYDVGQKMWEVIEFRENYKAKIPTFIRTPFVVSSQDDIVILGSQESKAIFLYDTEVRKFSILPCVLACKDDPEKLFGSQNATISDDVVISLCHNAEHRFRFHYGDTKTNEWELK